MKNCSTNELQYLITRILSGDVTVSHEEKELVKREILTKGLDFFFYSPVELFPYEDELIFDDGFNAERQKLDVGEYVDINYSQMTTYLGEKIEDIHSVADMASLIKTLLKLYGVFMAHKNEDCLGILAWLVGDLFFALGRYDNALACYDNAKEYVPYWTYDDLINAIFNTFYRMKQIPNAKYFVAAGDDILLDDDYLNNKLLAEYERHSVGFFEWILNSGNIPMAASHSKGVFDCVFMDSQGGVIRNALSIPNHISFMDTNAVIRFRQEIRADNAALTRLLKEFKSVACILPSWKEALNWYKELRILKPDEEILFHYRTPWLWKFHFDLFFPRRQLAVVFTNDRVLDETNFKDGMAGKIQHQKEWGRVLKKAKTKYGIKVVEMPSYATKAMVVAQLDAVGIP